MEQRPILVCRYHGPRLGTLSQPTQPKSPKGIRPKSQPTQERPVDPRHGYPKRIRPKSQPAEERQADPPPWYLGISYPEWLLTQVLTFPTGNSTKRSSQLALHITSVGSPMN